MGGLNLVELSGLNQSEKVAFSAVLDRLIGVPIPPESGSVNDAFSGEIAGALFSVEESVGLPLSS